MKPDTFVTLTTLDDPMQAEMLRELLERDGIPAAVPGALHRGLLGPLGAYITIPLQVPAKYERRARALLEQVTAPERGWEVIDEHGRRSAARSVGFPEDEEALDAGDDLRDQRPRAKRIAAFLALGITLGSGHFYARAAASGALLLLAEISVLLIGIPDGTLLTFLALPFLVAVDLLGSALAVERHNAGRPLSTAEQLLRTVPLALGAVFWAAMTTDGAPRIAPALPSSTVQPFGR